MAGGEPTDNRRCYSSRKNGGSMKKVFEVYHAMTEPQYRWMEVYLVKVYITFGEDWRAPDDWRVQFFSPAKCRDVTEYYEDEPDDSVIIGLILKSEKADDVELISCSEDDLTENQ